MINSRPTLWDKDRKNPYGLTVTNRDILEGEMFVSQSFHREGNKTQCDLTILALQWKAKKNLPAQKTASYTDFFSF